MFPQPGDTPGVVSMKLEMVDKLVERFKVASGQFPNDEIYRLKNEEERLEQDNALVTTMYNEAGQIAQQFYFNIDLNKFEGAPYAQGAPPVVTGGDDDDELARIMSDPNYASTPP